MYDIIMITRPLLAGTLDDISSLKFPVLATPKLDGIRVLKLGGKAVTRKFKDIPNVHIRNLLEKYLPDGVDGEIMTAGTFNDIQSKVMSFDGEPDFTFYAFDYVKENLEISYKKRIDDMSAAFKNLSVPFGVVLLIPKTINSEAELLEYETQCLADGFEGVMIRDPMGRYKCGRSTTKEQILLKMKRFFDAEARVIDFDEKMHNSNIKERDAMGLSKRSSKKEGLEPANTLGALVVEDIKTGVKFGIGTGFDDELRREIWLHRDKYKNKIVKYKYQAVGTKDAPRFPVFLGFRHLDDM